VGIIGRITILFSRLAAMLLVAALGSAGAAAPRSDAVRTLANPADPETFELVAMFAAHGYAVVPSDYLGFARSTYVFHPFLHADSEATTLVDAIRAARHAMEMQGEIAPSPVLLAGYSQGGHASAAAQRLIERQTDDAVDVVGAAHLAAPLNLTGAMQREEPMVGYQFFIPYLLISWQKIYGNVYQEPIEAFRPPCARTIESLLPPPMLTRDALLTKVQATFGPGGAAPAVAGSSDYATYYANYHSLYERPFCDAQARAHFDWLPEIGAKDPRRVAGVPIPDRR
jgi:hypothetical protein